MVSNEGHSATAADESGGIPMPSAEDQTHHAGVVHLSMASALCEFRC